jgi:putative transposase
MHKHMKVSLVKKALAMAYFRRPGKGLLHHSDRGSQYTDRGSQYTAREYQDQLK